jgi:hypothetical protein
MIGPDLQSSRSENLPMRPSEPTRNPSSPEVAAAERWLAGLEAVLEAEERALEPAGFEEVARAAEHALEEGERALWEERVARRPELARRAADLAAFRAEAYPERARVLVFPRASSPAVGPWLGWAAAAAALLLAVILQSNGPGLAPEDLQAGPAPPAAPAGQPLFVDGFEAGDPSSWTSVSTSG